MLLLRGHAAVCGGIFGCHEWRKRGAAGIWWAEARDAAQRATTDSTASPHPQHLLVQNVVSTLLKIGKSKSLHICRPGFLSMKGLNWQDFLTLALLTF